MRILHISDTHYLNDYTTNKDIFRKTLINITSPLQSLETLTKDLEFDLIIHNGDITHHGNYDDFLSLKTFIKNTYNIPMITTPGNHDIREEFLKAFPSKHPARYLDYHVANELCIISFDSTHTNNASIILDEDVKAIESIILNHPDQKFILFTHHHLIKDQFTMPETAPPHSFYELLEKYPIIAILTGHTHHNYVGSICTIPYYTIGSLSFKAEDGNKELIIKQDNSVGLIDYKNNELTYSIINDKSDEIIDVIKL